MSAQKAFRTWWILPVALLALPACDSGTEPLLVGTVEIDPINTLLQLGDERQLVVTVRSESGSVLSGHPVSWSSSRPEVASVTAHGLVRAISPGASTVTALSGGQSASVGIAVQPGFCTVMDTNSIFVGETRSGLLSPTGCRLLHWNRADGWTLLPTSGGMVEVELSSPYFRPSLVITDYQINRLAWAGADPDGVVRFAAELPAGEYILWAINALDEATGAYEISVRPLRRCGRQSVGETIEPGSTRTGSVDQGACRFIHGVPAVGFRLDLDEAVGLRMGLGTTNAEALLVVTDLEMRVLWWNAEWGGPFHARIERRIPAGEYLIWVTSFRRYAGAFELSLEEVDIELCPAVGTLPLGEAVTGSLTTDSCVIDSRRYADVWTLSLADSTTVQFNLTSHEFDAYLILENEDGTPIAEDDDGGEGLNSRLIRQLAPGEYRVVVTTYGPWTVGSYQLSAQQVEGQGAVAAMRGPTAGELFVAKGRMP